jgi:hypothetical protein
MKSIVLLLSCLLVMPVLSAKEENGMRVEVSKSTLSNNDERGTGDYYTKVDRTLGLKVQAKNTSMKALPAGKLEWVILIERWGYNPKKIDRFKGSEDFPALKPGESITLTIGQSTVGGYKGYSDKYQDAIEGWSVAILHDGKPTISLVSSSNFAKANERAKDAAP